MPEVPIPISVTPPGTLIEIPVGTYTRDQIVLGEFGSLCGRGRKSEVKPSASANATGRFIVSEGFDSAERSGCTVERVRITGDHLVGYYSGAWHHPFTDGPELAIGAPVANAITLHGNEQTVVENIIRDWRGNAIDMCWQNAHRTDRLGVSRAAGNVINQSWNGIVNAMVDTQVDGNRVSSMRDYGLYDGVGAVQSSNNHFYGCRCGMYFGQGIQTSEPFGPHPAPTPGGPVPIRAALLAVCLGGPSRSIGDTFADSLYGMFINTGSTGTHVIGGKSEHCIYANLVNWGKDFCMTGGKIRVQLTTAAHPGISHNALPNIGIVGLYLAWRGDAPLIKGTMIDIGDYWQTKPNDFPGAGAQGSTGILLEASGARIDCSIKGAIKADHGQGAGHIDKQTGIYVTDNRQGGEFHIDARRGGFGGTDSGVVRFATVTQPGQLWYITYKDGDTPVRSPGPWTGSTKVYVRRDGIDSDYALHPPGAY